MFFLRNLQKKGALVFLTCKVDQNLFFSQVGGAWAGAGYARWAWPVITGVATPHSMQYRLTKTLWSWSGGKCSIRPNLFHFSSFFSFFFACVLFLRATCSNASWFFFHWMTDRLLTTCSCLTPLQAKKKNALDWSSAMWMGQILVFKIFSLPLQRLLRRLKKIKEIKDGPLRRFYCFLLKI